MIEHVTSISDAELSARGWAALDRPRALAATLALEQSAITYRWHRWSIDARAWRIDGTPATFLRIHIHPAAI